MAAVTKGICVVMKEAYFHMSVLVMAGGNMVLGIVYCIDSRGVDGVGNSGLYYRVDFLLKFMHSNPR